MTLPPTARLGMVVIVQYFYSFQYEKLSAAAQAAAVSHLGSTVASSRCTTAQARKLLSWPKRCKLAHAFLWEYSYKRLQLAQLLGQLGVFLTLHRSIASSRPCVVFASVRARIRMSWPTASAS